MLVCFKTVLISIEKSRGIMAGNERKSSSKQTHALDELGNKSSLACKDGSKADSEISGVTSRSLRSHLKLSQSLKEVIKSDNSKDSEKSPKSSPKKKKVLKLIKPNINRVMPYNTRSPSSITILRNGKKKFEQKILRFKPKQMRKKSAADDSKVDPLHDEKNNVKSQDTPGPSSRPRKQRKGHLSISETSSISNDCTIITENLESSFSVDKIQDEIASDDKHSVETINSDSTPSGSPIITEIRSVGKLRIIEDEELEKSSVNIVDISSDNSSSMKMESELKSNMCEGDNNSTSCCVEMISQKDLHDSWNGVFDLSNREGYLNPVIVNSKTTNNERKSELNSEEYFPRLFLSESSISDEINNQPDRVAELELEGCPVEGGGAISCHENGESCISKCVHSYTKENRTDILLNLNTKKDSEPKSPTNDSVSLLTADESVSFDDDLLTIDDSEEALLANTTSDSESSSKKGFSESNFKSLIVNNTKESNHLRETSLTSVNDKGTDFEMKNITKNVNIPSSNSLNDNNKDVEKSMEELDEMAAITISSESSSLEYNQIRGKVDKALDPMEVDISSDSSGNEDLNNQTETGVAALDLKMSIQTSLADIVKKGMLKMSSPLKGGNEEVSRQETCEKFVVISSSNSPIMINELDNVTGRIDTGREGESMKHLNNAVCQDLSDVNEGDNAAKETLIYEGICSKMPLSNTFLEGCDKSYNDNSNKDSFANNEDLACEISIQKTTSEEDTEQLFNDEENKCSNSIVPLDAIDKNEESCEITGKITDGERLSEEVSNEVMLLAATDANGEDKMDEGIVFDKGSCPGELVDKDSHCESVNAEKGNESIQGMEIDTVCLSENNSVEMVLDEAVCTNEQDNLVEESSSNKDNFPEIPLNESVLNNANENEVNCSVREISIVSKNNSEKIYNDILHQGASSCSSSSGDTLISDIQETQSNKVLHETSEEKVSDVSLANTVTEIQPENINEKSCVIGDALEFVSTLEKDGENTVPSKEGIKQGMSCSGTDANFEYSAEQLAFKETMLNALGLQSSRAASMVKAPVRQGLPPIPSRTSGTLKTIIKVPRMDKRRARNRVKLVLKKDKALPEKKSNRLLDERFLGTEEGERLGRDAESIPNGQETNEDPFAFHIFNESNVSAMGTWNPQLTKHKSKSQGNSRKYMSNESMFQLDLNRMNCSRNSVDGIIGGSSTECQAKSCQDLDTNIAPDGSSNSGRSIQQGSSEGTGEPCLVIPEKSSSFSIHPERLCHDVCCYCFGKFGSLDTPMHIAQMKGEDKRRAALTLEPHLSMDSCLCDACYRYLDRKSSCPSYQPYRRQSGISGGILTKSQVCCVRGCSLPAHHLVRRKWLNRLKRTISKLLPLEIMPSPPNQQPSLHAPLCSRHYYCLEYYSVCGICKRKLSRNNMYPVGREINELNSVLLDDSIPVTLTGKIFLCKMCRYYSGIRLKYRDKKLLSKGHKSFFDGYRKRIWHYLGIQKLDPSEVSSPIEIPKKRKKSKSNEEDSCQEAEQSKHSKLSQDPSKQPGEYNSECTSDNSSHKHNYSTIPTKIRFKLGNVSIEHLENADPSKKSSKTHVVETVTKSSCMKKPEPSKPKKKSSSDSIVNQSGFPGVDQLGMNASFLFHGTDDSKEWERCTTTLQFDAKTKKLWQNLYYPYGNLSSFIRHLVIMERNWRNGDLVLAPNASSQAVNYVNSVQNRIAAYEGSVSRPSSKTSMSKHTVTKETESSVVPLPSAPELLASVPQKVTKDSVTVLPTDTSPRITITNPHCVANTTAPITAQLIPINATTNFIPITTNQFISLGGPDSYVHLSTNPELVRQINDSYSCEQMNQESVTEKDEMQKSIEIPVIGPTGSSSSDTFDFQISNVRSLADDAGNTNWEHQSVKQVQSNGDLIINQPYDKDKLEQQQINTISVLPITPLAVVSTPPLTVLNTPPIEISNSGTFLATVEEPNIDDVNQIGNLFQNV